MRGEVGADLVAQNALDERQIVIDQRRGLGRVGALLDLVPQVEQEAQVGAQLFFRRALGRGANDESAGGFAALVHQNALEPLALFVGGDFAADADVRDGGHEDQEAARQGDVRGDARALLGDGLLGDLNQNLLAGLSRSLMMGRSEVCMERREGPRRLPALLAAAACATAATASAAAAIAALPALRLPARAGLRRRSSSSRLSSSPSFAVEVHLDAVIEVGLLKHLAQVAGAQMLGQGLLFIIFQVVLVGFAVMMMRGASNSSPSISSSTMCPLPGA